MKQGYQFFIATLFLVAYAGVFSQIEAQQMPTKYPTLELFTNTPCPICGSQNPAMFDRLENYEGDYHLISFYPGTPYSSCIFYQANQSENGARLSFYPQVFGTPTVVIDGDESVSSSGITTSVMNNLTGGETWLQVRVEETAGTTRDVAVILEDFAGNSATSGKLYAVVVEKEIMYSAPNGETVHHNVFRKFLSSTQGDPVNFSGGQAITYYQYDVDMDWQSDQVYVVAWMTSNESKEIINSGTRFDEVLSSTGDALSRWNQVSVFPNPAQSHINIRIPETFQGGVLKIFDFTGRIVHEARATQVLEVVDLDAGGWKAGSYLVEVRKGNRSDIEVFQVVR